MSLKNRTPDPVLAAAMRETRGNVRRIQGHSEECARKFGGDWSWVGCPIGGGD